MLLTLPQAELAAQLLEEEWPDEDEVRAARMAVREEATPVPERAWALRNVASTLALGGPGERARARSLLEKAVTLKEQWLNDDQHPGDQDRWPLAMLVRNTVTQSAPGAGEEEEEDCIMGSMSLQKASKSVAGELHVSLPLFQRSHQCHMRPEGCCSWNTKK